MRLRCSGPGGDWRRQRRRLRKAIGPAAQVALIAVFAWATAAAAAPVGPAKAVIPPGAQDPVTHSVATFSQDYAKTYWSKARMESATAETEGAAPASPSLAKPTTIPNPVRFDGVRTVGALFFTTGRRQHFCTASVVASSFGNVVLTAAHCVYSGSSYATDIAFVPQWDDGRSPYGAWTVARITVAKGWISAHDPDLDFAFLVVAPQKKSGPSLQKTTGALRLGVNAGFDHKIYLIGYNDADSKPIDCSTSSEKFDPTQMRSYCNDYRNGTSGGPWILDFNRATGTGIVFGDIGGYERGGSHPYLSYSPYYSSSILSLFRQVQRRS